MARRPEVPSATPVVDCVVRPTDAARGVLRRSGYLTPYVAQTVAEDALHAGRGARLEVLVAPPGDASGLDVVRRHFAWLGARGVRVQVRRGRARRAASRRRDRAAVAPTSASR